MNPLDSISALSQVTSAITPQAPAVPVGQGISEGFHFPDLANSTTPTPTAPSSVAYEGPTTWGHLVQQMVLDVNQKQQIAGDKVADVLQGGPTPVHEAIVATQEAGLSFTFLSEVRNKVVESYQEIMRMQM